jgi:hypothetical protein
MLYWYIRRILNLRCKKKGRVRDSHEMGYRFTKSKRTVLLLRSIIDRSRNILAARTCLPPISNLAISLRLLKSSCQWPTTSLPLIYPWKLPMTPPDPSRLLRALTPEKSMENRHFAKNRPRLHNISLAYDLQRGNKYGVRYNRPSHLRSPFVASSSCPSAWSHRVKDDMVLGCTKIFVWPFLFPHRSLPQNL